MTPTSRPPPPTPSRSTSKRVVLCEHPAKSKKHSLLGTRPRCRASRLQLFSLPLFPVPALALTPALPSRTRCPAVQFYRSPSFPLSPSLPRSVYRLYLQVGGNRERWTRTVRSSLFLFSLSLFLSLCCLVATGQQKKEKKRTEKKRGRARK